MKRSLLLSMTVLLISAAAAAILLIPRDTPSPESPVDGVADEPPAALSAPSGLSAEVLENGELRLTWDMASVSGASMLELSYRRAGEADFTIANLAADLDSCLLVGFGDGETVEFRLRAEDLAGGYSPYSDICSAVTRNTLPPDKPAGFTGAAFDGSVSLSWEENSESDLLGYLLEYRKQGDTVWMRVDVGLTPGHTRDGLENGMAYEFRLMAKDSAGHLSPCSDSLILTPASGSGRVEVKPVSLSGSGATVRAETPKSTAGTTTGSTESSTLYGYILTTGKDSDILAVWDVRSDSTIAEVELSFQKAGASGWTARSAPYSEGRLRITALSPGTVYQVRVRTRTPSGWGGYSVPVSVTVADSTPPAAPAGLVASPGDGAVIISWTPNGETDLAGYRLEYRTAGSAEWLSLSPGKNAVEHRVTGLGNGTAYEFRLSARDAVGNWSAPSPVVSATPRRAAPPPAPSGLKAQATSHDTVLLTWNTPAASDGVTGYRLEYRALGNSPATVSLGPVTSHTITGLLPETAYSFSLWTMDAAGRLSDSPKTVTLITSKRTVPAPYNLSVTATPGGDGAVVSWSYPDDVSLSSFIIEYRLMGATKGQTTVGPLSRSCTIKGLPPEGGYQFYVTAVDILGNLSEKAGPVVLALVDETAPQAPSGLSVTPYGTGVEVSWSPPPDGDVAGYELRYGTGGNTSTITLSGSVTYASLSGLTPGATYSFSVRAFDRSGNCSPWSAPASCTIENLLPPDAPMGLTAEGGEGTLAISWWANSERNIAGYEVSWSGPESGSTFTTGTSLTLSLPPGHYMVFVTARTTSGVSSSPSFAAAEVTGSADTGDSGGEIDTGIPDGVE